MCATTRHERAADAVRAQQLRNKLDAEGKRGEVVAVVNDRVRMRLKQRGLPYKRGHLIPEMGPLLVVLARNDAVDVIRLHVLAWLQRRERAAAVIARRALPWLYGPDGPMSRRGARDLVLMFS